MVNKLTTSRTDRRPGKSQPPPGTKPAPHPLPLPGGATLARAYEGRELSAKSPGMLEHFYQLGIKPDWWKLPPLSSASWQQITALIEREDPWSRGILILGLDAPSDKLRAGFAEAAAHPMIKGFAVGRTIFGQPSRRWMQGELSDEALIEEVKRNYLTLIGYWREARR
ncbi:5-keto-2-deoxygluconokinase [Klebsiella pneumoniae]|nr:5-keto-2-deoxygluconokinase [Klebsiella pneumoniae]